MSWKIPNLCAERIFGNPTRKQIITFLADKASDDGSGRAAKALAAGRLRAA